MNYRQTLLLTAGFLMVTLSVGAQGPQRHGRQETFRADLRGRNEVPLTLSRARGSLQMEVNGADTSVHFVLQYRGLSTPVSAAHIHVAQSTTNGAIGVFLCGGTTRPACPQEGTVEGDFTANDVLAIGSQHLEAKDLGTFLRAIREGKTYVNVHTTTSPGGEIRGQIESERNDDDDDR
jgi:CHRD domain